MCIYLLKMITISENQSKWLKFAMSNDMFYVFFFVRHFQKIRNIS